MKYVVITCVNREYRAVYFGKEQEARIEYELLSGIRILRSDFDILGGFCSEDDISLRVQIDEAVTNHSREFQLARPEEVKTFEPISIAILFRARKFRKHPLHFQQPL